MLKGAFVKKSIKKFENVNYKANLYKKNDNKLTDNINSVKIQTEVSEKNNVKANSYQNLQKKEEKRFENIREAGYISQLSKQKIQTVSKDTDEKIKEDTNQQLKEREKMQKLMGGKFSASGYGNAQNIFEIVDTCKVNQPESPNDWK